MSISYSKIGDLFPDIKIGGTPSRGTPEFFGGSHLWVSIRDMNGKSVIYSTSEKLTDSGVLHSNCKLILKGSLLFSFKLTVGRVAFAGENLYTNEAIAAFDPESAAIAEIDLDYLSLVLPVAALKDSTKNSMGASLLNKDRINSLSIPHPTLDVQRQIATNLKIKFAEVEAARKALQIQYQDIRNLVARLKEQMFSKLEDAERIPLGDLLTGIEAGKSFQTLETLPQKNELGVIKVSAVSWGCFNPQEAKAISSDYLPDDRHRIYKGDLIISRANTIDLVGAVVKVDKDYPNLLLSDKTLRLVFDQNQVESDYLLYVLRWQEAREHIQANATGTSDSMRNISQKTINTIPIPILDKKHQQEIIKIERIIENEMNRIEKAHKTAIADIDILPNKLLAQIFSTLSTP
ncbi:MULTISPECIES: restriction endonuclease subunit S [Methylobacter]